MKKLLVLPVLLVWVILLAGCDFARYQIATVDYGNGDQGVLYYRVEQKSAKIERDGTRIERAIVHLRETAKYYSSPYIIAEITSDGGIVVYDVSWEVNPESKLQRYLTDCRPDNSKNSWRKEECVLYLLKQLNIMIP